MSRKTQGSYEDVFHFISENIFSLNKAQSFTTDYEMAMRNALKKMFPDAQMFACYFHYTQAVKRKVSQLSEVMAEINRGGIAKSIYQRAQCLPLLPADQIVPAFNELVGEANKMENKTAFRPFLTYMKEQWMKKVCV